MTIACIGIDAGGTKTAGILVDTRGHVLATGLGGPANYQAVGRRAAEASLRLAIEPLVAAAEERGVTIVAAGYGIAGLDRDKDEPHVRAIVDAVNPGCPMALVNDTYVILRAGTPDGVGVAVVSGTGSNCVATGRDGRAFRIGGLMAELGDLGSAGDIGRAALASARRGLDGRERYTILEQLIREWLGIDELTDVVDRFVPDAEAPLYELGVLAPLVFEAAHEGDETALEILTRMGRELGLSVLISARALFADGASFPLVMGGSVMQKGSHDAMRDALVARVREEFPAVVPSVLEAPPVAGAVLLAMDVAHEAGLLLSDTPWPDRALQSTIEGTVSRAL